MSLILHNHNSSSCGRLTGTLKPHTTGSNCGQTAKFSVRVHEQLLQLKCSLFIIKRIPCVCSCVIECVSRFYKGLYITLVVSPWPFQCFL